jgi:hypothetical protein
LTNLSQAQGIPAQGLPRTSDAHAKGRGYRLALPVFILALLLAWVANRQGYYTPGSDVGYYLGMAGGIMMLTLLLYPLRKHFSFLQPLGAIRHWFKLHMLFGILGPLLIIIHSAFGIGSLNAGVAMACMLLVAGSGVIGRFIYTRIHHGLYGRRASLHEMQAELGMHTDEVRSKFHFAPAVETRLKEFGTLAQTRPSNFLTGSWQFMTLALRAKHVRHQCMRDVRKVVKAHAHKRQWDRSKLQARLAAADHMIRSYLESARHTAQFSAYERMFSLWHILHVPFVFMLVISGVVHVIAVHMY